MSQEIFQLPIEFSVGNTCQDFSSARSSRLEIFSVNFFVVKARKRSDAIRQEIYFRLLSTIDQFEAGKIWDYICRGNQQLFVSTRNQETVKKIYSLVNFGIIKTTSKKINTWCRRFHLRANGIRMKIILAQNINKIYWDPGGTSDTN